MWHIDVLIVEDSRLDAKVLQGLMARSRLFEFDAHLVCSGIEARTAVRQRFFDLLFLDLGLPDSRGTDTLTALSPLIAQTPSIVLTGDDDQELAMTALRKGAMDYLVKGSIDLKSLEKSVRYAIERHKLSMDRHASELSMKEAIHKSSQMLVALNRANSLLEEEIARSRLLTTAIEQAAETVVITDVEGTILYANNSFEKVTGYSRDEVIGQNPGIIKSGLHDKEFYQQLWHSLATVGAWSGRIKNKKKDGSIFEEDVRISSVKDDTGKATNYVAVKRDVTHEAALELQLMQSRKLESIGRLAAGIAHEINTPSQYVSDNVRFLQHAMDGFLSVLATCEDISSRVRQESAANECIKLLDAVKTGVDLDFLREEAPIAIAQAIEGIERIASIVMAMKEFSHPGTEQMTVVDINRALRSTVTVASNEWKYLATVETRLEEGLPMVPCYLGEMNQVFLNIIVNAAHAIDEAQRENGLIRIETFLEEPNVRISISDNGVGIPKNIQGHIFDPFFTTKDVGKGTGQGLTMAFNTVVERHGGQLLVDSEEGEGATFSILLPLKQREEAYDAG